MNKNFIDGFIKEAGIKTEALATAGTFPVSPLALAMGMHIGPYSEKEQEESDKKTWSNALVPLVGPYRLGRRLATEKAKAKKNK